MMNDMISDCQKTSCIYKNGVAGAKPPYRSSAICATASCSGFVWLTASILAWLGAVAPVKFPFPGERGQGDRDSELEVCFKNKLFLQTDAPVLTGAFFLIILTLNRCNDTIEI